MDQTTSLLQKVEDSSLLKPLDIAAFGFGCVQNDICGSMVLGYLLVYCIMVLGLSNESATIIVTVCQIADGLGTISVGYLATRTKYCWFSNIYGNLKSWHLLGTVLVAIAFPLMFRKSVLLDHSTSSESMLVIYYAVVTTIFAFGWAISQISHLSMITAKSSFKCDWYSLTSSRNVGTVFANLVVITTFAILLSKERKVLPTDDITFANADLVVLCLGALASLIFHAFFKLEEKNDEKSHNCNQEPQSLTSLQLTSLTSLSIPPAIMTDPPKANDDIKSWLKQAKFYQVATTYTISRLFYTTAQTFVPIYVEETLNKSAVNIAIIQALMYFGGLLISFSSQILIKKCGLEKLLVYGSCIGIAVAAWTFLGVGQTFNGYQVYIMVMILGIVQSLFQICTLGKIAEQAGNCSNNSSFVYGFMCFADKLFSGISIYFFEKSAPNTHNSLEGDYYRVMIAAVFLVTSTLLGVISILELSWTWLRT